MHKLLAALLFIASAILIAWALPASRPLQPPLTFTPAEEVLATQWSPDETHLVLLHKTGKLTIYDVQRQTYRQVQTAARPRYMEDYCLFQSPDGQRVGVAFFTRPHIILEIYEAASGRKTNHLTLFVPVQSVYSLQVDWHPAKDMILVGYRNQNYLPGPLQAIELKTQKIYPIIHNAGEFSFSGSNLVILTNSPRDSYYSRDLHVTSAGSFETTPVKLDPSKGKLVTFATSGRGLYFTQRNVHNETEKITTSFWRNEAGRFKPAWSSVFQFPARYDALQDSILPTDQNEWAAVTIVFGTDGISGGRIWCVNKDNAISLDSEFHELAARGWYGSSFFYSAFTLPKILSYEEAAEIKAHGGKITENSYFQFDTIGRRHHQLPTQPLTMGTWSWSSISPHLKHIAVFRKEKESAPWRLDVQPLDWHK